MRSISSFFRWIVVSVWVLVMIPVLVDFLKKWQEANGGYKYAGEWIIDAVANVPRLPRFYPVLLVLSGMLVGVWFDVVVVSPFITCLRVLDSIDSCEGRRVRRGHGGQESTAGRLFPDVPAITRLLCNWSTNGVLRPSYMQTTCEHC